MSEKKRNFTKRLKAKWLKALKSGKYTQRTVYLENEGRHCCIGVLGDIHPKLDNYPDDEIKDPYIFLEETIGKPSMKDLYLTNDNSFNEEKPDYSNVIPLIEKLETRY